MMGCDDVPHLQFAEQVVPVSKGYTNAIKTYKQVTQLWNSTNKACLQLFLILAKAGVCAKGCFHIAISPAYQRFIKEIRRNTFHDGILFFQVL